MINSYHQGYKMLSCYSLLLALGVNCTTGLHKNDLQTDGEDMDRRVQDHVTSVFGITVPSFILVFVTLPRDNSLLTAYHKSTT